MHCTYVARRLDERRGGEGRFLTFSAASSESNLVPPSLIAFVDPPSKKRNSFSARVPPFRQLLRQKDRPIFLGITNCRLSRPRHFYIPFVVSVLFSFRFQFPTTVHSVGRNYARTTVPDRVSIPSNWIAFVLSLRDAPTEFTADRTDSLPL